MRIVYFDLAQGQLHIGFGEVVDDALALRRVLVMPAMEARRWG